MSIQFISHKAETLDALHSAVATALEVCGGVAESYAKQLCPVDTGNLRNSITHRQQGADSEAIGTNVEYAPFVELGTRKMSAKPYLRPAAENHADEYRAIFQRALGE